MKTWRLLDTEKRPAAENMCLDEAVLEAYGWQGVDPDDRLEILKRLRLLNAKRAKAQG